MSRKSKIILTAGIAVLAITIAALFAFNSIRNHALAYMYAYPLVLMDETRQTMIDPKSGRSPENHFTHIRSFPGPDFRQVVRPNNDTLYSVAWLDLSNEPIYLRVPDTGGRYYVMPLMDMWTNVFASIGSRNTGTEPGNYLLVGPGWDGVTPDGVTEIRSPTTRTWIIGRIATNTKEDFPDVYELQERFRLIPFDLWPYGPENRATFYYYESGPDGNRSSDPAKTVEELSAAQFFQRFARIASINIPESDGDQVLDMLEAVGLRFGIGPHYAPPGMVQRYLIDRGVAAAREKMKAFVASDRSTENGWTVIREDIGRYGTNYARRAIVALVGLGALPTEEAAYPNTSRDSEGRFLTGAHSYRLHFDKGQLPPANAFWSLTMYDERGFLVKNEIERYAIGDRDSLVFNADGSLDLIIQHDRPDQPDNWLPAPTGQFALTLRLYVPETAFLDGTWKLPPVQRKR